MSVALSRDDLSGVAKTIEASVPVDYGIQDHIATGLFRAASYLTEPTCLTRELYMRIRVVDHLEDQEVIIHVLFHKIVLGVGMIGCGVVAVFTTVPGIALRALGIYIQKNPFIYVHGDHTDKILPDSGEFTLYSWNICGIYAGYCIDNGAAVPFSDRKESVLHIIEEQNTDVLCAYEVFDINDRVALCNRLKPLGYNHFYFNMGAMPIGVPSGLFVASKHQIHTPEFTPFAQDPRAERGGWTKKGIFSFDLLSAKTHFATIHSTHPHFSEEPARPTPNETAVKQTQMQTLYDRATQDDPQHAVIVTGDLNLGDDEYDKLPLWKGHFHNGKTWGDDRATWPGDTFCKTHFPGTADERPSTNVNLDHTLAYNNNAIEETVVDLVAVNFDPSRYTKQAGSDHNGVRATVRLRA